MTTSMATFFLVWLGLLSLSHAGAKSKEHGHTGVLEPYDGKHISYSLTPEQNKKLQSGDPVVLHQKEGRSGRGLVIQDINAPPQICIDRIRDLPNYPKMCPTVKRVEMYDESKFQNGTTLYGSEFKIGISFFSFNYYMRLKYDPKYYTFLWTLDYQYNSDFDDSVGHWQAMAHPTKPGWTRVLYSTQVKLFSWIPEFVVAWVTKTALVDATTWVKRESEKVARQAESNPSEYSFPAAPDLKSCFLEYEDGSAKYDTKCIDDAVGEAVKEEKKKMAEHEVLANEL